MRDLGVILDAKLPFSDHVDATVGKANRILGLLMRSIQTSPVLAVVTLSTSYPLGSR